MSDLQFWLIIIGVVFVACVFAYNHWQERKHRKMAERVFSSEHSDVLFDKNSQGGSQTRVDGESMRVEPTSEASEAHSDTPLEAPVYEPLHVPLGGTDFTAQPETIDIQDAETHTAGYELPLSGAVSDELLKSSATDEPSRELIDPSIDCVVRFESSETIVGGYLWQSQNQALAKLTKPVVWVGLDEHTGAWECVTANGGGDYRRLRAALLLADRRGPISDAEITLFFNGMQRLADEFLAVADLPAREEVLALAADLDRFCAGVDIQIGVNVVSVNGSFSGTKLRGQAEAAGLELCADGMFHARDEVGNSVFTLSNLEPSSFTTSELRTLTTNGITFTLDVPRVADGGNAFDQMAKLAQHMAKALGGNVVDDNRIPLAGSALEVIRDKIVETGQQMATHGIIAGWPQARRLFS